MFSIKYENLRSKLLVEFRLVDFGSVTTDCWSSNSNLSYMGLTFHYVDDKMGLRSRNLNLYYLEEAHSAAYLSQSLDQILVRWNIRDKVTL